MISKIANLDLLRVYLRRAFLLRSQISQNVQAFEAIIATVC